MNTQDKVDPALHADLALALPRRPRFIRELVVVPLEGETLVDGADQLQILRGASASSLLPHLITLMDGSRTLPELAHALPGVPAEHVQAATSLLSGSGLLEDGAEDAAGAATNPETLAFFRRFVGATGVNRSGQAACDRLTASEVVVVESGPAAGWGDSLVALLAETGVTRAASRRLEDLKARPPSPSDQPLLLSLSCAGEESPAQRELDDWCAAQGLPWFRAVVDEGAGYADVGPLFKPGLDCCYRCLEQVHGRRGEAAVPARPDYAVRELWGSLIAVEILYVLSRIGPAVSGRGFRRYDLRSGQSMDLIVPRIAGCRRCRPLAAPESGDAAPGAGPGLLETALVLEDYVGLESRAPAQPRAHAEMARLAGLLSRQSKSLAVCEQLALNDPLPEIEDGVLDILAGHVAPAAEAFTLAQLAAILKLTAGIRDTRGGVVKRWAATAGNLGSVEVFVAARHVDGLAPGLYFYEPHEHALAALRWRSGGLEIDELIDRVVRDGSGARPDALVFLTGAFHRVSRKYGSFGYRLVQLDAGAAVSQLHLVAAGLGLWSQTARPCADDLIEAQLGLDAPSEQSTAVVKLSRKACPPPARLSGGDRHGPAGQDRPASLQPARSFYELSSADVAARAHRDSRLPELEIDRGFREGAAPRQQPVSRGIRWCDLPAPERGGASLGGILARRSSLRRYAASPVLPSQLGTMLHHASQGDATDWPEEPAAARSLKFMVLAWRLEGLAPGRYLYDPACHALGHIGPVVPAEEICGLMVQDEFAAAPLHVWIVGDLAAACARHGAWGHRQLLMRAGTACHRLWFAGLGTGLGGTIVAGVVPGAVRNRLGLDGYRQAALLVFAAGQEPEDTLEGQS